jgi:hypothetical protein
LNFETRFTLLTPLIYEKSHTSVGPEDLFMSKRQPLPFSRPGGTDSLQLDTSHRAFWKSWPLLQVLEHQLATGSADLLPAIRLGIVGQSPSVGDTLNHLQLELIFQIFTTNSFEELFSSGFQ